MTLVLADELKKSCRMSYEVVSDDLRLDGKPTKPCRMTYEIVSYDLQNRVVWPTNSCRMTYIAIL